MTTFRELSEEEELDFRRWARGNLQSEWEGKEGLLHPVVRDEWERLRLIDNNRPGNKIEDVSLCIDCKQRPPKGLSICGPCLEEL